MNAPLLDPGDLGYGMQDMISDSEEFQPGAGSTFVDNLQNWIWLNSISSAWNPR